jgi:hypothetical protein
MSKQKSGGFISSIVGFIKSIMTMLFLGLIIMMFTAGSEITISYNAPRAVEETGKFWKKVINGVKIAKQIKEVAF